MDQYHRFSPLSDINLNNVYPFSAYYVIVHFNKSWSPCFINYFVQLLILFCFNYFNELFRAYWNFPLLFRSSTSKKMIPRGVWLRRLVLILTVQCPQDRRWRHVMPCTRWQLQLALAIRVPSANSLICARWWMRLPAMCASRSLRRASRRS